MGEKGAHTIGAEQLAELWVGVDAVLYDDGRVEEGVPYSHGRGILTLPTQPLSGELGDQLKVLYAAGVRLLLVAGVEVAQDYSEGNPRLDWD